MKLTGLHLLLTYQCTFECDHCFVWGSPWQSGTMTLANIRNILRQAQELGGVEWIYFEGGEPTLFYSILLRGVQEAKALGFRTGIVSNAYWATSLEDALETLKPFAGLVENLTVSSDLFHYSKKMSQQACYATQAAEQLGIPLGVITVAHPDAAENEAQVGQIPSGESSVMYRGRAAVKLVEKAPHKPWLSFNECPHEDLIDPGRVHLDPLGNLHLCQGIVMGNLYREPLKQIVAAYDPYHTPVISTLLAGGPAALITQHDLPHQEAYADACHLCYEARLALRQRYPETLAPDQVYGVIAS
jgi:hypothetical protein